jgi:uncharacterized protein (DUF433 family)
MPTLTPSPMPHIYLDERGRGWIDDTNVKVIEVVLDMIGYGWTPKEIYEGHNHYLSLAQIHAALTWYYDHQAEYDAEIERQDREYQALWEADQDSPIRRKLREMGKIP